MAARALAILAAHPVRAVISNAEVSLLGPDDNAIRRAQTNAVGEVVFTDLPIGDSRFVIAAPGFIRKRVTVTVRGAKERKIETMLEVDDVGGTLVKP